LSSERIIENDLDDSGSADTLIAGQVSEKALLSTGIRVGTLVKTKDMSPFISRTRPDGLHVIDTGKTLSRIETAGRFLSRISPKGIVAYSSRDYGKTPVEKFCELTETISITGRFMPGTFTNPLYPGHVDPEIVIVSDPSMDSQAVTEATTIGVPVLAICDTDNVTSNIDYVIPANNRGRKALAAVFWLLARSTLINSGKLTTGSSMDYTIEDFETKILNL